tara:strand:+ start:75 stop:353 length:279 start_codon:yes stop_codon:yes gene_type:complete
MQRSKYWWKITQDHIDEAYQDDSENLVGPRNADQTITANKAVFKLYDDDGELYYSGEIYGDYDGFEPLDDFGAPNAGCTAIKIEGGGRYEIW